MVESNFTISAETFLRIHPKEFTSQFIAKNTRADGRSFDAARKTMILTDTISTANGSSQCRMGDTLVLCGVQVQIAPPLPLMPRHGFLVANIDLPQLCHSKFKTGAPSNETQVLTEFISKIIVTSQMIDLTQLCICEGKAVWVLNVDVIVLNHDGNLIDACMLAIASALKTTKLPLVEFNEMDSSVIRASAEKSVCLNLDKIPMSVSFGVFDDILLVDPTSNEENVVSAAITVVCDEQGDLLAVLKLGGGMNAGASTAISTSVTKECVRLARSRLAEIIKLF